ncbi:MAG: hypothetical protein M1837_005953 [Sclerophora amabilis]|nr:MAG: hypothetical protein M1837_005953 [Sclerophora amabilis]
MPKELTFPEVLSKVGQNPPQLDVQEQIGAIKFTGNRLAIDSEREMEITRESRHTVEETTDRLMDKFNRKALEFNKKLEEFEKKAEAHRAELEDVKSKAEAHRAELEDVKSKAEAHRTELENVKSKAEDAQLMAGAGMSIRQRFFEKCLEYRTRQSSPDKIMEGNEMAHLGNFVLDSFIFLTDPKRDRAEYKLVYGIDLEKKENYAGIRKAEKLVNRRATLMNDEKPWRKSSRNEDGGYCKRSSILIEKLEKLDKEGKDAALSKGGSLNEDYTALRELFRVASPLEKKRREQKAKKTGPPAKFETSTPEASHPQNDE